MADKYDLLLDLYMNSHVFDREKTSGIDASVGFEGKQGACIIQLKGRRYGEIVPFTCPLRVLGNELFGKTCVLKEACKYA